MGASPRAPCVFRVTNRGPDEHEFIVIHADGGLPLRPDGITLDEDALEKSIVGSIEPASAGKTHELRLQLKPGPLRARLQHVRPLHGRHARDVGRPMTRPARDFRPFAPRARTHDHRDRRHLRADPRRERRRLDLVDRQVAEPCRGGRDRRPPAHARRAVRHPGPARSRGSAGEPAAHRRPAHAERQRAARTAAPRRPSRATTTSVVLQARNRSADPRRDRRAAEAHPRPHRDRQRVPRRSTSVVGSRDGGRAHRHDRPAPATARSLRRSPRTSR